jgi:hypothetical protein
MLAPLSPSSLRVRAQSAPAEQLTRQLAVVVTANNQLEQQLLQLEVQRSADQRRIQWLERLLEKAPPEPRPPGPPILEKNVRENFTACGDDDHHRTLKWDGAKLHDGERGAYVDSGALAACLARVLTSLSFDTHLCHPQSAMLTARASLLKSESVPPESGLARRRLQTARRCAPWPLRSDSHPLVTVLVVHVCLGVVGAVAEAP